MTDNIDWTTFTPYWKVVSVVNGANAWTIPAGYRYYRILMNIGSSTAATTPMYLAVSNKTGTAWTDAIFNTSGGTPAGVATSWASTSPTIAYLTPVTGGASVASGVIARVELARTTVSGTGFRGLITSSGSGWDFFYESKLEFTATEGCYLYATRSSSTLSNFYGYVEALVEE